MPSRGTHRRELAYRALWALIDASLWLGAVVGASWLRYDFDPAPMMVSATLWAAMAAGVAQIVVGSVLGPYAIGHNRGSFEETVDIGRTTLVVGAGLFAWAITADPVVLGRSIPITATALALLSMFATRFIIRTWRHRQRAAKEHERKVILFGAGDAGRRLLHNMVTEPQSGFKPVALLDDDKAKSRLRIDGVRVRGTRESIARVAGQYGATSLVIAMPLADAATIRDLSGRAEEAGLDVLTLPPLRDIIGGLPTATDLRDVDLSDLLGRRPVSLVTSPIADQIAGHSVLVTGAGGSIGSELCRQIARFAPSRLYLLDRDESGLQESQLSLAGHGLLDSDDVILADLRDLGALRAVFRRTRPDMVFHAAALKHLPLLEQYPLEAWKSNVVGTLNVLSAAAEAGVGTFVNISTDKAANPTCVLGYSKRVTERLTADFARNERGRYVSVRFGNVLGSRGSVIHAFTAQISAGGPVTVTHPDVARYFMLIPEACQLVLEAASIGADGEVMVLDMGEQVRIVDVARTLIRMSGRTDVDVVYTGLRPGEKLAEQLFSEQEDRRRTDHPLISSVAVPDIDAVLVRATRFDSHDEATAWMREQARAGVRTDA